MNTKLFKLLLRVAGSALLALLLYYASWMLLDGELRYLWPFSWGEMLIDYLMCFIISLVVSIFYWRSYIRMQRERDRFKLQSLENQINPHFVFNNFSALSQLIEEDPKRAQQFLMNLSKVYRYNLNNVEKPLVPINEELLFLDQYMHIMEQRFGQTFSLIIDPEVRSAQGQIPPCSLQMLVENALKHNEHTLTHPLAISISIDGRRIAVANLKQPLKNMPVSTNMGNHNLLERYSLLSHDRVLIENTEHNYRVAIPIL